MKLLFLRLKLWLGEWGGGLFACSLSYYLLWASHAPRSSPESVLVFLVPLLIWIHFRPSVRKLVLCTIVCGWVYHAMMVGWMRHISPGGVGIATLLLSFYYLPWFLCAHRWYPRFNRSGFSERLLIIVGLSSLWVSLEWLRTFFTLGFPWCPVSATQWERPVLLQASSVLGGGAISFFLIFFNLSIASYIHHLLVRRKKAEGFLNRSICPEFYLGLLLLLGLLSPYFSGSTTTQSKEMKLIKVGICQPYLLDKWESGMASKHKEILRKQTEFLAMLRPDLILWPEASTPYPLNLDSAWVNELSAKTGIPMLVGSVIREDEYSYNAMVYVDPVSGVQPEWYAKQVLVPFGEYIPFPFNYIPGLRKMVGPVGNFTEGDYPYIFELPLNKGKPEAKIRIAGLICYEDIFPALTRDVVQQGVDLLVVSTNDAWFKEEGCAEQHAAHSVLRAVENRIPIVRCGNAGWSGWIDSYGFQREVLRNEEGSIYFQGASVVNVEIPVNKEEASTILPLLFDYFCLLVFLLVAIYNKYSAMPAMPARREV